MNQSPSVRAASDTAGIARFHPLFVAGAVVVCFSPALDNFFTSDDFTWLFHSLKTLHHPLEFFRPMNGFLRYSELSYFLVPLKIFGLAPFPFFLLLVVLHGLNAALVAVLITRLSGSPPAGAAGGLFWGLNYKLSEVVLSPYAVADALALCFGLLCLLLVLRRRFLLASLVLVPGLFGKENAVVFPVMAVLMLWSLGRSWFPRVVPLFAVAGLFAAATVLVRTGSEQYLVPDGAMLSRFWESWLTYLGPDATWLKQVPLSGIQSLFPGWLAVLLLAPFAWLVWRLPADLRFGVLWTSVAVLPSLALSFQSSRYHYVPLVGVAIVFAGVLRRLLWSPERCSSRWGIVAIWTATAALAAFFLIGIHNEERAMDRHGELHRWAADSFRHDVAPSLDRSPETTLLFLRSPNLELARSLFPAGPWYRPETYKWVFRRSYGILGLANTYGFVSFCTYRKSEPMLFVAAQAADLPSRLESGKIVVVYHDADRNRFSLLDAKAVEEVRRRGLREDTLRPLQPGFFDPTCGGDQTF